MKSKPGTIDEYLAGVSTDQRMALDKLRRAIHAAVPKVEERISYGIPAFRLNVVRSFSSAPGPITARFIQAAPKH